MAGRGRPRKKPVPQNDPLEAIEDTIEDSAEDSAPKRARAASPKRVLDETGKAFADAGAVVLTKASRGRDGHGLLYKEAQSITTPIMRIIGRRIPKFLKKFAPVANIKLDPLDVADLEEIAVTICKYCLRLLMSIMTDFGQKKEEKQGVNQREKVLNDAPQIELENEDPDVQSRTGVSSRGHNPLFNLIGADFGQNEVA